MLISDWSSDVCSSDLSARFRTEIRPPCRHAPSGTAGSASAGRRLQEDREHPRSPSGPASAVWSRASPYPSRIHSFARSLLVRTSASGILDAWARLPIPSPKDLLDCGDRSEEHTSELPSLMRLSDAVFIR